MFDFQCCGDCARRITQRGTISSKIVPAVTSPENLFTPTFTTWRLRLLYSALGTLPLKRFSLRLKIDKLGLAATELGISPSKLFRETSNLVNAVRFPSSPGSFPDNSLFMRFRVSSRVQFASSEGICPRRFPDSMNSYELQSPLRLFTEMESTSPESVH